MDINKAIRNQNKSYNRFLLFMCFVFFMLQILFFFSKKYYIFYYIYLVLIDLLILAAIAIRSNKEKIEFKNDNCHLYIKEGIGSKVIRIVCSKIVLVHIENMDEGERSFRDFKIILIASSKFKNGKMVPINMSFLKKHAYISYHYNKMKMQNPTTMYFYTIINSGRVKKYKLLDIIYRTCVYAFFTEETVEKIKLYRAKIKKN